MSKNISLIEAEQICTKNQLKNIVLFKRSGKSIELQTLLTKFQEEKEEIFKCVLLIGGGIGRFFTHASPVIIQKKQDNYRMVCLETNLNKYIEFEQNKPTNLELITPINQFENKKISIFGNGLGCLELAVYALEKLDLQKGIILNGEKGHSVEALKNGDKYSTEELAKLTRSEKYLAANGINPKTLIVTNTEGKTMSLETYRTNYKIDKYNELLNLLSGSEKRVPVERTNSLEDLQKLLEDSTDPRQKETIKKITNKRTVGK